MLYCHLQASQAKRKLELAEFLGVPQRSSAVDVQCSQAKRARSKRAGVSCSLKLTRPDQEISMATAVLVLGAERGIFVPEAFSSPQQPLPTLRCDAMTGYLHRA